MLKTTNILNSYISMLYMESNDGFESNCYCTPPQDVSSTYFFFIIIVKTTSNQPIQFVDEIDSFNWQQIKAVNPWGECWKIRALGEISANHQFRILGILFSAYLIGSK